MEYVLSRARGGFPTIKHSESHDLTDTLLTEVGKDVCIEPDLQLVMKEHMTGATANSQDGASLDILANGV